MAHLRKEHGFFFEKHQGVKTAEIYTFPASGTLVGIKSREKGADSCFFYLLWLQEQSAVWLFHIAVNVSGIFGCRSKIDCCQCFTCAALAA